MSEIASLRTAGGVEGQQHEGDPAAHSQIPPSITPTWHCLHSLLGVEFGNSAGRGSVGHLRGIFSHKGHREKCGGASHGGGRFLVNVEGEIEATMCSCYWDTQRSPRFQIWCVFPVPVLSASEKQWERC